jgi:glutamate--cysteine ligase
VLEALVERHGWHARDYEYPGGPLIALARAGASITLEPGGQLELSGAPLENVHQICFEMSGHLAELRDISKELGIVWLGVGFHPFARQEDLDWVPKARYGVMQRVPAHARAHGLDMMRRTATVQANFDYSSEADAMRKLRVSLRLSPLVTAMFANSPFYEGRRFGGKSYRAQVWLDVDPIAQGLVPSVLDEAASASSTTSSGPSTRRCSWSSAAEVATRTPGSPSAASWPTASRASAPTLGDWETHLNTMFPEVRLKRTLEVRGADSLPSPACALPALWTGLLYDERACERADELRW